MNHCLFAFSCALNILSFLHSLPVRSNPPENPHTAQDLNVEDSPVLQRWQRQVPNVLEDIKNEPSFRTRLRLGYNRFSTGNGINIGVEDIFIGQSRLTISGDYQWGI